MLIAVSQAKSWIRFLAFKFVDEVAFIYGPNCGSVDYRFSVLARWRQEKVARVAAYES